MLIEAIVADAWLQEGRVRALEYISLKSFMISEDVFFTNNLMGTLSTFALANTKWIASNAKISFILRCLESVILSWWNFQIQDRTKFKIESKENKIFLSKF